MKWQRFKAKAHKIWVDFSEWSVVFFKFRLLVRRIFRDFNPNYETFEPKGFVLDFVDTFTGVKLDKWKWSVGQRWGKIHPDYKHQYSDESCINISNAGLVLTNKYKPKLGTQWVGQEKEFDYDIDYAHGEIETHRKFLYGIFEIISIIPIEDNVTTSFWLFAPKLKEVDVYEFFPKHENKNSKGQLITIHWDSKLDPPFPKKYMSPKAYNLPLSIAKKPNTYTLIWLPNKLEFLFNGEVIRRITNKKVLATLNVPMGVIIGVGLVKDPGRGIENLPQSPHIIKSFKYWKWL